MGHSKKIIILLFLFVGLSSCWHQQTCEESKKVFTDLDFEMILENWEINGNYFHLYGAEIQKSLKPVEFHNTSLRCFNLIEDNFHKGDTIIKKKGEAFIKIYHGKDHFKFTYVCENEYGEEINKFKQERF